MPELLAPLLLPMLLLLLASLLLMAPPCRHFCCYWRPAVAGLTPFAGYPAVVVRHPSFCWLLCCCCWASLLLLSTLLLLLGIPHFAGYSAVVVGHPSFCWLLCCCCWASLLMLATLLLLLGIPYFAGVTAVAGVPAFVDFPVTMLPSLMMLVSINISHQISDFRTTILGLIIFLLSECRLPSSVASCGKLFIS
jgi:hypothetical protein